MLTGREIRAEKYILADVLDNGIGSVNDGSYAEALRRAYLAGTNDDSCKSKLITSEELAEYLRVSKLTVFNLIKRGELKCIKIGNCFRFSSEDVEDFLKRSSHE